MPGTPPLPVAVERARKAAKLLGALAGGKYADPEDRGAARRIRGRFPDFPAQVKDARRFGSHAALDAVLGGAKGVLVGACGYPCDPDPHAAALEAVPQARVVYATVEPRALFLTEGLLGSPSVSVCEGSLRDPGGLLSHPRVRAIGEPFQVQAPMTAHYWDAALARGLIAEYAERLSAGSTFAMSVLLCDPGGEGRELAQMLARATGAPVYSHTAGDVASWFGDAGMILAGDEDLPPCGRVTGVREYRLRLAGPEPQPEPPWQIAAAVARVP